MHRIAKALLVTCSLFLFSFAHAAELRGWVLQGEEYPDNQGLKYFFSQLKTRTNGRFDGQALGRETLGDQKKALSEYAAGKLDVAVFSNSAFVQAAPQMEVLSLPFMFNNSQQLMAALDGDIGKDLERNLAAKGMVVLAWYNGGSRSFYTRAKPARFATDFAGMKVRVANVRMMKDMVSALDATPLNLPYDQVNAALESGAIDAAENDIISYEVDGHYKRAKYYFESNHASQPEALVVSAALWAKLPEADRRAFRESAQESAVMMRALWDKKRSTLRTKLEKEGVKFYELKSANSSAFVSRMKTLYDPVMKNPDAATLMLKIMTIQG